MGKVKKSGAVRKTSKRKAAKAPKKRLRVTKVARNLKAKPTKPVSSFRVRELDPAQRCGTGTSVQRLFRIDESIDGAIKPHLVFFDRHGWYCEHGRDCPAVPHAQHAQRTFGTAKSRNDNTGPTHNGRMRA